MAEGMNVKRLALSSREVSEGVKRGDHILKKKKNTKGSRAWQKFRIAYDESSGEEVFGYACCVTCKTRLLYKKLVDGTEKSMGMKNLLDHLKHCVSSQTMYRSTSSSSTEAIGTPSVARTLNCFVKRSGKRLLM